MNHQRFTNVNSLLTEQIGDNLKMNKVYQNCFSKIPKGIWIGFCPLAATNQSFICVIFSFCFCCRFLLLGTQTLASSFSALVHLSQKNSGQRVNVHLIKLLHTLSKSYQKEKNTCSLRGVESHYPDFKWMKLAARNSKRGIFMPIFSEQKCDNEWLYGTYAQWKKKLLTT